MDDWKEYLKNIYYNPKHAAAFAGPQKLDKVVKNEGKFNIGMHRIRRFLHDQESYSLHKPVRRRFQRNYVVSAGKDDLWMADLIDMVKFADWNQGFKYILLVIDTFSKYVWLQPLKYKTGDEVARAFEKIFTTSNRSPTKLITDKGQEFRAKKVQNLMKKKEVHYFPTQNETKASTSERAILTIKTRLMRYFSYKETATFLPVIQDIADSYNKTHHRTIGMRPVDVKATNQEEVRLATYFTRNPKSRKQGPKLKPFKLKVGDFVRISHLRNVFTRAYDETYTGEVFKVHKRYNRGTLPVYRLRDLQDEDITGTFYESELQKTSYNENSAFKIEKILKTKGKGLNQQYFVKWKYYPRKFNSWIKASDFDL
ncbi:YMD3-like protein [Mya arenaria]|uniref:YMD3-like protein n=1 Tax=Mya arenaria TaxID=6604 RepID=A0ABY7GDC2_MYAAR|nr:YMD3-like protein [Mya arenaria]